MASKSLYKVLLVDDELIILSGLKSLIDWESIGCYLTDPASNGQEAVDIIKSESPDIVICDIGMPVFDGLEVLRRANTLSQSPVFIMLTNYEDFHMAQKALKYKAVDYLTKTNLKPEVLISSIETAKTELLKRRNVSKVEFLEDFMSQNHTQVLQSNLHTILNSSPEDKESLAQEFKLCNEANVFNSYFIVNIYINTPDIIDINLFSLEEKNRIVEHAKDILSKIAKNFFSDYLLLSEDKNFLRLLVYNADELNKAYIKQFHNKVLSASKNMLETSVDMILTNIFNTNKDIYLLTEQLEELSNFYFYNASPILFHDEIDKMITHGHFELSNVINPLNVALVTHNSDSIKDIFKTFKDLIITTKPSREDVVNYCIQIYNYTLATLQSMDNKEAFSQSFSNSSNTVKEVMSLHTFNDIALWVNNLEVTITNYNLLATTQGSSLIESAIDFIHTNIDSKLTLNSVADSLNITPSYFSSLFKKEVNRNFIDYVNELKIKKACLLIKENKHLIYEIAYMIGFDNAYYFSKIFKKYKNMTPTEYAQQLKDRNN